MITETNQPDVSKQVKAMADNGWKGVPMRPRSAQMGACVASGARMAHKHNVTVYIVATAYGPVVSPKSDAQASYEMQGGYKISPSLDVTRAVMSCYA